jgi:hypothetical protein
LVFTLLGGAAPALALDATIAWTPVSSVQGYKLYVRANGGVYGPGIDLGPRQPDGDGVVRAVHNGLAAGVAYTFAVTTYASGGESDLSNEQTLTITAPPTATRTRTPPPTATRTWTPPPVATHTATRTWTVPPTATRTPPPTATRTATATRTYTRTPLPSPSFTPTAPSLTFTDVTDRGAVHVRVSAPRGGGNRNVEVIRDGDMPVAGTWAPARQYDTWDGANTAANDHIGYVFPSSYRFRALLFQEGMHFWDGGWFDTLKVQVRRNGKWNAVSNLAITPVYLGNDGVGFNSFLVTFDPIIADGIRLRGKPGGSADFISVGELRVFGDEVSWATSRLASLLGRARAVALAHRSAVRAAAAVEQASATPTATPTPTAMPED